MEEKSVLANKAVSSKLMHERAFVLPFYLL